MDWFWYLFRFDGRINRALLWQALLIVMVLACIVGMIDQAIKVQNGAATFAFNFKLDFDFSGATDASLDRSAVQVLDPVTNTIGVRALTSTGANTATLNLLLPAGGGVLLKYKNGRPFARQ